MAQRVAITPFCDRNSVNVVPDRVGRRKRPSKRGRSAGHLACWMSQPAARCYPQARPHYCVGSHAALPYVIAAAHGKIILYSASTHIKQPPFDRRPRDRQQQRELGHPPTVLRQLFPDTCASSDTTTGDSPTGASGSAPAHTQRRRRPPEQVEPADGEGDHPRRHGYCGADETRPSGQSLTHGLQLRRQCAATAPGSQSTANELPSILPPWRLRQDQLGLSLSLLILELARGRSHSYEPAADPRS